jgi:hypothetical protein
MITKRVPLLTLAGILLVSQLAFAYGSKDPNKKFTDRLFLGGAIGLTFGDITQVDIVPIGGIWVIPQWSAGVGGRYSYYRQRGYSIVGQSQTFQSNIWGVSGFTQILPIPDFSEVTPIPFNGGIFFHGEIESLYIDRKMIDPFANDIETGKTWIKLYLIGVGYRQKLGERAAFNVMLLWDITKDSYSPYISNPMFRVNFTF